MRNPLFALSIFALIPAVLSIPQARAATPEVQSFPAKGLTKLIVENENGSTKVISTAKSQAVVGVEKKNFPDSCKLTQERTGDTLTVRVTRQSIKPAQSCEVDINVRLPAGIDASLASGSGNIRAEGPFHDLSFQLGSGDFESKGSVQHFMGETGSGHIKMQDLSSGGELRAGSGSIEVAFAAPIQPGKLVIKTGSGDAKVRFPKGTKVKAEFAAGSGKLKNDFPAPSEAAFTVTMEAGSGSLDVVKE